MEGFQPKLWDELSKEERAKMLCYLMYLKEKRDRSVKGQGCANWRPQEVYTSKQDTTTPTVTLAGLMITCVINAFEQQDVASLGIPLQTKTPKDEEDVHIILE